MASKDPVVKSPKASNGTVVEKPEKGQKDAKEKKSKPNHQRLTGTVKWFNVKDGFGFITRHDTGEEVFVPKNCIVKANPKHRFKSVGEGEEVEFGLIASKVSGPNWTCVKGSTYAGHRRSRVIAKRKSSSKQKSENGTDEKPESTDAVGECSNSEASSETSEMVNAETNGNHVDIAPVPMPDISSLSITNDKNEKQKHSDCGNDSTPLNGSG